MYNETLWDRYQIIEPIGRGGLAEVYRVADIHNGQEFAAKVVQEEKARSNSLVLEQFKQEARLHPRLIHENIVSCHEVFVDEEPQGMILELVDGPSLRQLLDESRRTRSSSRLSSRQIMQVITHITQALTYLHANHLCHCDVKPENILYDSYEQRFKLTDFGISQNIGQPPDTIRGTPKYMPPEQFQQQPLDARTDVYSFGITIYEMLSGRVPFVPLEEQTSDVSGTDSQNGSVPLREKHMYKQPPRPEVFNKEIKGEISDILLRSLEKDPNVRYRTVAELCQAIEAVVEGRNTVSKSFSEYYMPESAVPAASLVCTTANIPDYTLSQIVLIGRNRQECNFHLRHMQVSRRHSLIQWEQREKRYRVWDQGSKLGTRVNGRRVDEEGRGLADGDLITIGPFNFRMELRS
jgi:eukaryotic-like serine/threonine-protein kinase